jgi:hypothetical protein
LPIGAISSQLVHRRSAKARVANANSGSMSKAITAAPANAGMAAIATRSGLDV